ncbi:hypothetical protein LTR37_000716 [Vermiconidia calcicola]|uniref:Uncharacterized protein n=1 Tax=Vermiconidia calcicola TaxID=1690605 RepID=A0ACC3NZD3_9PEZI|nr:hypothetical protein LTR37_000716 [Vermiconidia calcicola]
MRDIKNVLVAGPNGTLGQPVLRHLQKNESDTTLLTRNVEKTKQAFPGLQAIEADYDSPTDLQTVLQHTVGDQDALVILINRDDVQAHINLLSAAAKSGIRHIIPSSFDIGMHSTFPIRNPVFENKARMEEFLAKKAREGRFGFSAIQTGAFFDWALERGLLFDVKHNAPSAVFDGGDVPLSGTTLDDIGKAIAAVLKQADQFRNRFFS